MYQLSEDDKKLVAKTAEVLNLQVQTFDDEMTDTLVDINGTHTVDRLDDGQFLVCHVTVIPGVRYHSDGSGTPDDVDVTELSTYKSFLEALASATSLATHQVVFQLAEAMEEDKMFQGAEEVF
jgi:hypothetical protein